MCCSSNSRLDNKRMITNCLDDLVETATSFGTSAKKVEPLISTPSHFIARIATQQGLKIVQSGVALRIRQQLDTFATTSAL